MTPEARAALREKVVKALDESCQNDVPILYSFGYAMPQHPRLRL
jgi:hypothetical protein